MWEEFRLLLSVVGIALAASVAVAALVQSGPAYMVYVALGWL